MKLSIVSRINSALIIFFVSLMVAVGVWGWVQMEKPYTYNREYQQLKSVIEVNIRITLERYLRSGNATLLAEAEKQLKNIAQHKVEWLPQDAHENISASVAQVLDELNKVRDAGKLSANPQGLLVNNERDRMADVMLLKNYVDKGALNKNYLKSQYLEHLSDIAISLQQISYLRQRYIETKDTKFKKPLLDENSNIEKVLHKLNELPRLGIYSEDDDDEYADDDKVEKGQESIDSLISLTSRYEKELNNTLNIYKNISESQVGLAESLDFLSSDIEIYETEVDAIKSSISQKVKYMISSFSLVAIIFIVLSFVMQNEIIRFLHKLVPFLKGMTEGNYDYALEINSRFTEVSSVTYSANQLRYYLVEIIEKLQAEADAILATSKDVQSVSEQASVLAGNQTGETEHVASSIEQMSQSFVEVATHAANASTAANRANEAVQDANNELLLSNNNVEKLSLGILSLVKLMHRLEEGSNNVQTVLDVIQSIAEQTNLLALNAAIEAARAGEQGRGFAVVADEVRQLAQRTADSTLEIRNIVENLSSIAEEATTSVIKHSKEAEVCVESTQLTQKTLLPVIKSVQTINDMNAGIAAATEEQSNVAAGVVESSTKIKRSSEIVNINLNAVRESSDSLSKVSEELNKLVAQLRSA